MMKEICQMLTIKEDDDQNYFYRFHLKQSLIDMRRDLNGRYLSPTHWPQNTSKNPKDLGNRNYNEGWPHDEFLRIQKNLKNEEKIFKLYVWRKEKDVHEEVTRTTRSRSEFVLIRIRKSCSALNEMTQIDDDYLPNAFILYQVANYHNDIYGPAKISWECIEGFDSKKWVPLSLLE
jgi:hypothetical protein